MKKRYIGKSGSEGLLKTLKINAVLGTNPPLLHLSPLAGMSSFNMHIDGVIREVNRRAWGERSGDDRQGEWHGGLTVCR